MRKALQHFEYIHLVRNDARTKKTGLLGEYKYILSNKLVNGNFTLFCCYNTSIGHNTSKTTKQQINSIIIEYFQKYIERHNTVLFIKIWTEWVNPDSSLNYRADPDYRQTGPWYNWCMVEWGDDPEHSNGNDMNLNVNNNFTIHSVPAKILCFYTVGDGVAKALVHSCHYQSTNDINTATTEQWRLQYQKLMENWSQCWKQYLSR